MKSENQYTNILARRNRGVGKQYHMVKTGFTANDPKGKIWIDCKTIERDYPELTKQFEDFKKLTADT